MNNVYIGSLPRFIAYCGVFLISAIAGVMLLHPYSAICISAPSCDELVMTQTGQHQTFTTADGTRLSGWLYHRGSQSELVICYPGNSANVSMYHKLAESDTSRSYLLFNYRGYGSSEGKAGEKEMLADASALLQHYQKLIQPRRISLIGFSLGTCVAIRTAAAHPQDINNILLICPFDSMLNIVAPAPNWKRYRFFNCFDVSSAAEKVRCPVTIFVAEHDEIVPMERTQALLQHFRHQYVFTQSFNAGHTDILKVHGFKEHILEALSQH